MGDVTSVGTPTAGVFFKGQASVVAAQIISRMRGSSSPASYDGQGTCYLEFGHDQVARVTVTFLTGQAPVRDLEGPSLEIADDKGAFGTTRIERWLIARGPEISRHHFCRRPDIADERLFASPGYGSPPPIL